MADFPVAGQSAAPSAGTRLFLAVYFGSHKVAIGICFLLRAADIAVKTLVTGVWLGLLTPSAIRKLDDWYYSRGFDRFLDESYNRSGLFDWERPVIETYFSKLSSVVIAIGAGAAREMLALNQMNIAVDGFEYNLNLVHLGNRLLAADGWPCTLFPGPADEMLPAGKQYDGAIVGWAAYTLIPGKARRMNLLRQIRSCCSPGAPILVSFFDRLDNDRSCVRIARVADVVRSLLGRPKVESGDTLSVHWAHRFTEREIAEELSGAGFRPVFFRREPYAHAIGIAD